MDFVSRKNRTKLKSSTAKLRCICGSEEWNCRPAPKNRKPTPILVCARCGRERSVSRTVYALYRYLSQNGDAGREFRGLYDIT
jgi:hypothetical protein